MKIARDTKGLIGLAWIVFIASMATTARNKYGMADLTTITLCLALSASVYVVASYNNKES